MKSLNWFIFEKLHINKDTKIKDIKSPDGLLEKIEHTIGLDFRHNEISKVIKDWVDINDVTKVSFYVTKETKDILIYDYSVSLDLFKDIIVNDEETEKLKDEPKIALFKKQNDPTTVYGNKHILVVYSIDNYIVVKKEN